MYKLFEMEILNSERPDIHYFILFYGCKICYDRKKIYLLEWDRAKDVLDWDQAYKRTFV